MKNRIEIAREKTGHHILETNHWKSKVVNLRIKKTKAHNRIATINTITSQGMNNIMMDEMQADTADIKTKTVTLETQRMNKKIFTEIKVHQIITIETKEIRIIGTHQEIEMVQLHINQQIRILEKATPGITQEAITLGVAQETDILQTAIIQTVDTIQITILEVIQTTDIQQTITLEAAQVADINQTDTLGAILGTDTPQTTTLETTQETDIHQTVIIEITQT